MEKCGKYILQYQKRLYEGELNFKFEFTYMGWSKEINGKGFTSTATENMYNFYLLDR